MATHSRHCPICQLSPLNLVRAASVPHLSYLPSSSPTPAPTQCIDGCAPVVRHVQADESIRLLGDSVASAVEACTEAACHEPTPGASSGCCGRPPTGAPTARWRTGTWWRAPAWCCEC